MIVKPDARSEKELLYVAYAMCIMQIWKTHESVTFFSLMEV